VSESTVAVGVRAPDLTLPSATGAAYLLSAQRGRHNVVLVFVRSAADHETQAEMRAFRDASELFAAARSQVVGIGHDALPAWQTFVAAHDFKGEMLADVDGAVAQRYGVEVERGLGPLRRARFRRSTFLIDRAGIVRKIFRDVRLDTHVNEVLAFLDTDLT